MKMNKLFLRILAMLAIASCAHAQSTSGAIEQLPSRALSYVLGHDGSGLVGREPVTDFLKPGSTSPPTGNVATWGSTGSLITDGGKGLPSGAIVGTTDTQTLTNKSIDASQINSGTLPASRLSGSYPSVTQINGALFGNAGSNPYIGGNGNVPFSFWANGKEFLRGFDNGSEMQVWARHNEDALITPWYALGEFVVGATPTYNGIVGIATNDGSRGPVFPTAVTGIAYNKDPGNTAFGMYAEGHAVSAGGVSAAELDAFQDGAPAPTTFPFNNSFGTTQTLSKGIQVAAGTKTAVTLTGTTNATTTVSALSTTTGLYVGQLFEGANIPWNTTIVSINSGASTLVLSNAATSSTTASYTSKSPAAVGIQYSREGGTIGVYQFGIGFEKDSVLGSLIYADGQGDVAAGQAAYLSYAGAKVGFRLRATGTSAYNQNPNFTMMQLDSALYGNGVMVAKQNGDVYGRAWTTNGIAALRPTIATCTGVGTGGTCALETGSNDGAGTIIITAGTGASAAGGSLQLNFALAIGSNGSACFLQPASGSANWSAASSFNITAQSTTSVAFVYLNGPPAGTALTASQTYKINYFCTGH